MKEKKNIIASLIQEYDIKTTEDIQKELKDFLGGTSREMKEVELDEHLGYEEYERSDNPDYKNRVKYKIFPTSVEYHLISKDMIFIQIILWVQKWKKNDMSPFQYLMM